jgi:acyl-[acyl carrier protein]--UDP-N-acetylglucosamine O-acyltransferase
MKKFVNLNYNEVKMKQFILSTIEHIRKEYKLFYQDYLSLEEEISDEEILQIINDNFSVRNFITTSDKFLLLCGRKICELTS